jgi:hypothetical protein
MSRPDIMAPKRLRGSSMPRTWLSDPNRGNQCRLIYGSGFGPPSHPTRYSACSDWPAESSPLRSPSPRRRNRSGTPNSATQAASMPSMCCCHRARPQLCRLGKSPMSKETPANRTIWPTCPATGTDRQCCVDRRPRCCASADHPRASRRRPGCGAARRLPYRRSLMPVRRPTSTRSGRLRRSPSHAGCIGVRRSAARQGPTRPPVARRRQQHTHLSPRRFAHLSAVLADDPGLEASPLRATQERWELISAPPHIFGIKRPSSPPSNAMNLEDDLGKIQADRANLQDDRGLQG